MIVICWVCLVLVGVGDLLNLVMGFGEWVWHLGWVCCLGLFIGMCFGLGWGGCYLFPFLCFFRLLLQTLG